MNLLPLTTEREYMAMRRQLYHDLTEVITRTLTRPTKHKDARGEELLMLLGLRAEQLLNREAVEARLRELAKTLDKSALAKLQTLLGRPLKGASRQTLEAWVGNQADLVFGEVSAFVSEVGVEAAVALGAGASLSTVANTVAPLVERVIAQATKRASFATLQLNVEVLREIAETGGARHYRWVTQKDSRVRDHHSNLEGTVQSWEDPPMGGGTEADEKGHPGSGWGCRCTPEPVV